MSFVMYGVCFDGHHGSPPFELVNDGDLLFASSENASSLGVWTRFGLLRLWCMLITPWFLVGEDDRLGNDAADEAADIGRRRVGNAVIDARRNLSGVCGRSYPVILDFHRFFISISRAVVNDGHDGTAPDPLLWSAGALSKRRRLVHAVRNRAFLPAPLVIGILSRLVCLCLLSVLRMWLIGHILLVFWLSGSLFLALYIGLLVVWILGLVVSVFCGVAQEPAPSKCVLLSTSREVRHSMKDWVLSQEGDQWSVKFDVRDLGGHLDTTFRGWSSTLAARVRFVLSRLILIFALPLDFHGRIRVVRSMYIPAALHGIEASLLASDSLRKLRSAICRGGLVSPSTFG